MNQVDKELMQEKGILTENEKADEYEIQKAAMKEAVFFLAAMLEKNLDMSELQTISLYLKELSMKQHYMHIHLYVQQLYRNSRPQAELAEMVENCKDNIRRLERNKFINPTYQLHHDFTEFFEKPVEEILGYEEI